MVTNSITIRMVAQFFSQIQEKSLILNTALEVQRLFNSWCFPNKNCYQSTSVQPCMINNFHLQDEEHSFELPLGLWLMKHRYLPHMDTSFHRRFQPTPLCPNDNTSFWKKLMFFEDKVLFSNFFKFSNNISTKYEIEGPQNPFLTFQLHVLSCL